MCAGQRGGGAQRSISDQTDLRRSVRLVSGQARRAGRTALTLGHTATVRHSLGRQGEARRGEAALKPSGSGTGAPRGKSQPISAQNSLSDAGVGTGEATRSGRPPSELLEEGHTRPRRALLCLEMAHWRQLRPRIDSAVMSPHRRDYFDYDRLKGRVSTDIGNMELWARG